MVGSVLFVCNQNSVRSPMAAALLTAAPGARAPAAGAQGRLRVDSAGVWEGAPDPFIEAVLAEAGASLGATAPKTMTDIDLAAFDLIVVLTPEAKAEAEKLAPGVAPDAVVEYWETENPSDERGGREQIVDAYRRVRDDLAARLAARFPELYENS